MDISVNTQADRVGVVQLLDKLAVGGMERIAVDVANYLPQEQYRSYLCTTRLEGPLLGDLAPHVGYKCLWRKHRFDIGALGKLVSYIRKHHISIIHAHSSALFAASLVSLFPPFPKIVWHCHSGWSGQDLAVLPYWMMTRRARAIVVVNNIIHKWIVQHLRYPEDKLFYVRNFSSLFKRQIDGVETILSLPGVPGKRIVCVAGIWGRKDQRSLVQAMEAVHNQVPDAHLFLVGGEWDKAYADMLRQNRQQLGLENHITFLGVRRDIAAILTTCDVGVLSSLSEGLPVAVLEYGLAGLGVVCTRVGQCEEVLDDGKAGLLVPPEDPLAMASALTSLLIDDSRRRELGDRLRERVNSHYSLERALEMIVSIYQGVMG